MSNVKIQRDENRIYTYRYIWKKSDDGKLCIKILSGVLKEHEDFCASLVSSEEVLSCVREYLHEYDINFVAVTDVVKKEVEKK